MNISIVLKLTLLACHLGPRSTDALDAQMVSLLSLDATIAPSLVWTGAPLQIATEHVNARNYGVNMSSAQVKKMETLMCNQAADNAAAYTAEYYHRFLQGKKCFAILGSGCTDVTGVSKLAREWDVLYFLNSFPPPEFPNLVLYPNTVLLGPTHDTVATATVGMMGFFGWYHITVFMDAASTTNYYSAITAALKIQFDRTPGYDADTMRVNASDKVIMKDALQRASKRSRVFFLMSTVSVALEVMRIASWLGMGNGEYVSPELYDTTIIMTGRKIFSGVSQAEAAYSASETRGEESTALCVVLPGPKIEFTLEVCQVFENFHANLMGAPLFALPRRRRLYLLPQPCARQVFVNIQGQQQQPYGTAAMFDHPDDTLLNVTRSLQFLSLTQVKRGTQELTETIERRALKMYNSTYPPESPPSLNFLVQGTMDSVEVFGRAIVEAGERSCAASVLLPHIRDRTFNLSMGEIHISPDGKKRYDVVNYVFNSLTGRMEAMAVFNGSDRRVDLVGNFSVDWVSGSPPLDIPLCGFLGNSGPCAPQRANSRTLEITLPLFIILGAASVVAMWKWQENMARRSAAGKLWLIDAKELSPFSQMMAHLGSGQATWKNIAAWLTFIDRPEKFHINSASRYLLFAPHANLVRNYGLCVCPGYLIIVSEFCAKGSLAELTKASHLDLDFKLSFMMDLLQGLTFLHSTTGPHGRLRPQRCLIDGYFTLKIAEFGFHELKNQPGNVQAAVPEKPDPWTAPEFVNKPGKKSAAGDVFSLGLVMAALLLDQAYQSKESFSQESNPSFQLLIADCLAKSPHSRPSVQKAWKRLVEAFPEKRLKRTTITERIIARFALHTSVLEEAVTARTAELKQEQAKCDMLLQQMLPPFVVERLRNQETVDALLHDSVTIYFSELEGFLQWATNVKPSAVLQTLSITGNAFDQKVSEYAVQKVESVGDCYMVVGGIPERATLDHSEVVCNMAIGLQSCFRANSCFGELRLRCGIHTGPCASGVIGLKVPRYCLFGDAVNVASRVQTSGEGGRIHLSQQTALRIAKLERFHLQDRGLIFLKGKGMVRTYWLEERGE